MLRSSIRPLGRTGPWAATLSRWKKCRATGVARPVGPTGRTGSARQSPVRVRLKFCESSGFTSLPLRSLGIKAAVQTWIRLEKSGAKGD